MFEFIDECGGGRTAPENLDSDFSRRNEVAQDDIDHGARWEHWRHAVLALIDRGEIPIVLDFVIDFFRKSCLTLD